MEPEQKTNGNGALIGLIVIIIILIVGGYYIWRSSIKERAASGNPEDTTNLEADVNSIDLENLDEGI